MSAVTSTKSAQSNNLVASQARINTTTVKIAQEIAGDFHKRVNGYKDDPKLLEAGCWYPSTYHEALRANNSGGRLRYFKNRGDFYHCFPNTSKTNFVYYEDSDYPGGKKPAAFKLSEKCTSAAQSMRAFRDNLTIIDCTQFIHLVYYLTLLEVMGEERFNFFFTPPYGHTIILGGAVSQEILRQNPISSFTTISKIPTDLANIQLGQVIFFQNDPTYSDKHIGREAQGYNTICIDNTKGQEKFITLGFPPEGLTHAQINEKLVSGYNMPPNNFSMYTDTVTAKLKATYHPNQLAYVESLQNRTITVDQLRDNISPRTLKFNASSIDEVLGLPVFDTALLRI